MLRDQREGASHSTPYLLSISAEKSVISSLSLLISCFCLATSLPVCLYRPLWLASGKFLPSYITFLSVCTDLQNLYG